MSSLTFNIKYRVNTGLIISVEEFINQWLFGVELKTVNGEKISNEAIRTKILGWQNYCEKLFGIKINYEVITESTDYDRQMYLFWGKHSVTYNVTMPLALLAYYGNAIQSTYPVQWVTKRVTTDDNVTRNINVVPNGNFSIQQNSVLFQGLIPQIGFQGLEYIPNYWHLKYLSGFSKIPQNFMMLICKLAAIEVLTMLGDVTLGAGINNQSLSLDGFSQSTTKFGSGKGIYSGRIEQYIKEINGDGRTKGLMQQMRDYYIGFNFMMA